MRPLTSRHRRSTPGKRRRKCKSRVIKYAFFLRTRKSASREKKGTTKVGWKNPTESFLFFGGKKISAEMSKLDENLNRNVADLILLF